jgi:ATP-dependent exoDNAse (exonuclease V) alpha subunit
MGSTATPIFCSSGPIKIGNMSVTRHQVPVTPAWAITDYKVQGSTYDAVTLDLHRQSISSKDGSSHMRYCSCYVQLTRVRSLQSLFLLQPVTLNDVNGKPNKLLLVEDQRIAQLATSTEIAWELSAGFRYG